MIGCCPKSEKDEGSFLRHAAHPVWLLMPGLVDDPVLQHCGDSGLIRRLWSCRGSSVHRDSGAAGRLCHTDDAEVQPAVQRCSKETTFKISWIIDMKLSSSSGALSVFLIPAAHFSFLCFKFVWYIRTPFFIFSRTIFHVALFCTLGLCTFNLLFALIL